MASLGLLGHSVKWGVVSTATTTLLQLGLMAVMARLLLPADYGLVATAGVALRFLSYFAQMGVAQAVIQKPHLEEGDIGAALSISMSISLFFTLAAAAAAPLAQWFFDMPGLGWVVAALSLNFVMGGVGNLAIGLLRRRLEFRTIAFIEVGSYLVGYGLWGLPAAWSGAHEWALVGATLLQAAVSTLASGVITLRGVPLAHGGVQRRYFLSSGGRFAIVGFLEFLTNSFDAIVVGKLFGPASAGLYNRAQLLANLPAERPAGILTRALFPYLSGLHSEREKQAVGVQLSLMLVGGYAFAVSAGVAVAAPDMVSALLGPRWKDAAAVLRILAFAVGPMFVTHIIGTAFDSLGRLRPKIYVQLIMLSMLVLIVGVLYQSGLKGIAAAVVIAEFARAALYVYLLQREFGYSRKYWLTFIIIAIAAAIFVAGGSILASSLTPAAWPPWFRMGWEALGAMGGALIAFSIVRPLCRRTQAVQALCSRSPLMARIFSVGIA